MEVHEITDDDVKERFLRVRKSGRFREGTGGDCAPVDELAQEQRLTVDRCLPAYKMRIRIGDSHGQVTWEPTPEDCFVGEEVEQKDFHSGMIGPGHIGKVHAETLAFRLPEAEIVRSPT